MDDKPSLSFKWLYGINAYGNGLLSGFVSSYIMIFLSDVSLVPVAFIGSLFFFSKILNMCFSPVMGVVIDRTETRWGKIKPWLLVGTLLIPPLNIAIFTNTGFTGTKLLFYVAIVFVLGGLFGTIFGTAMGSVFPTLTRNVEERQKLSVIPGIGAVLGDFTTVGAVLPLLAVIAATQAEGYFRLALIFAALFMVSNLLFIKKYKERTSVEAAEKIKLKEMLKAVAKNDQLLVIQIVSFLLHVGTFITTGSALYFFKYNMGNEGMYATFGITVGLSQVVMMIIFPKLMRALTKKSAFILACAILIAGYLLLFLSRGIVDTHFYIVYIGGIMLYLALGITSAIVPIFTADIIDYGAWKTGERNNSTIVSITGVVGSFSEASKDFIVGTTLAVIGFVPNIVQSQHTLDGIVFLMTCIPMILVAISLLVFTVFYKLNDTFYNRILLELDTIKK
ncbi:melibiose permease [Paenibacillus taihuensis]|uniref:Melibiose permease n=1 Tax=Paenibacillus taihuensis TaxID=1156355 RepID=A0A3D9SCE4_9BACL|nr:glycoside-pentoside-hexuronide (GPH):cation symporter [Paenibacillus taihuensis]REE88998.1 melibiose permease [Paenibacillus taihuensis]